MFSVEIKMHMPFDSAEIRIKRLLRGIACQNLFHREQAQLMCVGPGKRTSQIHLSVLMLG